MVRSPTSRPSGSSGPSPWGCPKAGFSPAAGLVDVYPPDQRYPIAAVTKFLFDLAQKPRFAILPYLVDIHVVHTRRTLVGLHPSPGLLQDVLPTDLIVEKREPPFRLLLGHSV